MILHIRCLFCIQWQPNGSSKLQNIFHIFQNTSHFSLSKSDNFSRAVQVHTAYLICLSALLVCVSELLMKATRASNLAKGSLWLGLHNPNYFSSRDLKVPCPFFPLLIKRISLGSEGGVLEAQQQCQWPKVTIFASQITYRETEMMQNLRRCLPLKFLLLFCCSWASSLLIKYWVFI